MSLLFLLSFFYLSSSFSECLGIISYCNPPSCLSLGLLQPINYSFKSFPSSSSFFLSLSFHLLCLSVLSCPFYWSSPFLSISKCLTLSCIYSSSNRSFHPPLLIYLLSFHIAQLHPFAILKLAGPKKERKKVGYGEGVRATVWEPSHPPMEMVGG